MSTTSDQRGRGRPATGQTPKRYFRMDDDSWAQIVAAAQASGGESVSEYIRRVVLRDAKRVLKEKQAETGGFDPIRVNADPSGRV